MGFADLTLSDRLEIEDLVLRFADAVCRNDPREVAALWADEGTWTIDPPKNFSLTGTPAELSRPIEAMPLRWDSFLQITHGTTVRGSGDAASARTYLTEIGVEKGATGSYFNHAVYEDELIRTAEGWRFRVRRYRYLYIDESPLAGRFTDFGMFGGDPA